MLSFLNHITGPDADSCPWYIPESEDLDALYEKVEKYYLGRKRVRRKSQSPDKH